MSDEADCDRVAAALDVAVEQTLAEVKQKGLAAGAGPGGYPAILIYALARDIVEASGGDLNKAIAQMRLVTEQISQACGFYWRLAQIARAEAANDAEAAE